MYVFNDSSMMAYIQTQGANQLKQYFTKTF